MRQQDTRFAAIVGTLDTKGQEIAYMQECFRDCGRAVKVIDVGVLGVPEFAADVTRQEVAARAGTTVEDLRAGAVDKIEPLRVMAKGALAIIEDWLAADAAAGVISLGGGVGTWVAATIMRDLPFGLPKIIVSTLPFDIRPQLGAKDIVIVPSVADLLGLNPPLRTILRNAVAALCGMAENSKVIKVDKPLIGITGLGITTPAVLAARRILEGQGFEIASFHAAGLGGRVLEQWIGLSMISAVLDLTTHELTDQIYGGTGVTTEDRLLTAGRKGIPAVVAPGGVDVVSRGPIGTLSVTERKRPHYRHSPYFTHVRVPPEGMRRVAGLMARKLNAGNGPVVVAIPLKGFSDQGRPGGKVHDAEADAAFIETLKKRLASRIRVVEIDSHINDLKFAVCVCRLLRELMPLAEPSSV